MKHFLIIAAIFWTLVVYKEGYERCRLEFVEAQQARYEQTIKNLTAARNEVAAKASEYRAAAESVRADAERLQHELRAAQSHIRDKRTAPATDTSGRSEKMAVVLERATALIAERDAIALQYNELREQCRLR